MIEKQSTGDATLLIHMLANMDTNMFVRRTLRGLVPALLKTKVASTLAMLYFDRAAAMVKPPSRSMITGVHIAPKMYPAAGLLSRRMCGGASVRTIRSRTTRNGTNNDVTNSGIAYRTLAHVYVPM